MHINFSQMETLPQMEMATRIIIHQKSLHNIVQRIRWMVMIAMSYTPRFMKAYVLFSQITSVPVR